MQIQTKWQRVLSVIALGSLIFLALIGLFAYLYYISGGVRYAGDGHSVSFFDAFYFALVTFLTIGFGDIVPVSSAAKGIFFAQGYLGLILPPVFSGLLFYSIIRRPRNVFLAEHIYIRHMKEQYLLSIRVGNRGDELANVKGVLELFHYRGTTRRRTYQYIKEYPLLEERWYFDIKLQDPLNKMLLHDLQKAVNEHTEIALRFTLTGMDVETGESVVVVRYYHGRNILFGKAFKQIYEWENGKKVRYHWHNFERIEEMEPELREGFKKLV